MSDKESLLPKALGALAPSVAAFALDEATLCCSFSDDLDCLKLTKVFLDDQLKYVETKYIEQQLRVSRDDLCGRSKDNTYVSIVQQIHMMKSANYDIEDIVIDSYQLKEQSGGSTFLQKVSLFFSSCNPILLKVNLIQRMKSVRTDLRKIQHHMSSAEAMLSSGSQESSCVNISSAIVGRDSDLNQIKNLLKKPNTQDVSVIPILGPVGVGKTSIAFLLYHDTWVAKAFSLRVWVSVSMGTIDIKDIGQQIISKAGKSIHGNMELKNTLHHVLSCQSCFIVLDGVWSEDEKVIELKQMLITGRESRSKIIVTTQSEKTADMLATAQVYRLPTLSDDHCSAIFRSATRVQNLDFIERYGDHIIARCEGNPLVAKFLGSVVNAGERSEKTWKSAKDVALWKLEERTNRAMPMFQPFKQIYYHMPAKLRMCFIYCSIFSMGSDLDKEKIARQWISLGFIQSKYNILPAELLAELFIEEIRTVFFFTVAEKPHMVGSGHTNPPREVLRMHTLAYNLARSVGRNDILVLSEDDDIEEDTKYCDYRYGQLCTSALQSVSPNHWPLKARALSLKAYETDLKLLSKVISANTYLRVLDLRGCATNKYLLVFSD